MSSTEVGVRCGNCGGNVFMVTCDNFRGTGHEWVLASLCMICRAVHWIESGCPSCHAASEHKRIVPLFDADLNRINEDEDAV